MLKIFGILLCVGALMPLSSVVMALWSGELRDHRFWKRKNVVAVRAEKAGLFWGVLVVQLVVATLYGLAGALVLMKA
jgi:hypothetical protein